MEFESILKALIHPAAIYNESDLPLSATPAQNYLWTLNNEKILLWNKCDVIHSVFADYV